MSVEVLGNMTGCYERCLAGMRKTPGVKVPAELNRKANLIKYGAIVVSSLPIMTMYPFVQKYFNQGVMIGALKG